LRHLVIARVSQPASKLAATVYLKSYYNEDVDLNHIYRYMDKLYDTQRELVQQISVRHTRKVLGDKIGLMFYDVTTLYFESARTDDLREPGFSKDGKTSESQVVLGLLVSEGGLKYIIDACIKSESSQVKKWILDQGRKDNRHHEHKRGTPYSSSLSGQGKKGCLQQGTGYCQDTKDLRKREADQNRSTGEATTNFWRLIFLIEHFKREVECGSFFFFRLKP